MISAPSAARHRCRPGPSPEDADAIDWAPLANGSAKVVEAGEWRGISGRAQARICTDPIQRWRARTKARSAAAVMEKHFAEAVAELYFMEHLAGSCVEINRALGAADGRLATPRRGHRAGVASMAWRSTRRFSTNVP